MRFHEDLHAYVFARLNGESTECVKHSVDAALYSYAKRHNKRLYDKARLIQEDLT